MSVSLSAEFDKLWSALKLELTLTDEDLNMLPEEEIEALKTWIKVLRKEIAQSEQRIILLCSHEFVWHQIAGEGQICKKCGFRNYNCDD